MAGHSGGVHVCLHLVAPLACGSGPRTQRRPTRVESLKIGIAEDAIAPGRSLRVPVDGPRATLH